jgi:hypothetical protein
MEILQDTDIPADVIDKAVADGITDFKLIFASPRTHPDNITMREMVCCSLRYKVLRGILTTM